MSTRGLIGFRQDGRFQATYNHCDSYPSWLGKKVVEFVKERLLSPEGLAAFRKNLAAVIWVDSDGKPSAKDVRYYMKSAKERDESWKALNTLGSARMKTEWYALLRDWQGIQTLEGIADGQLRHLPESVSFIQDSLFCEYAYLLDLDRNVLEFWEGFQRSPQEGNPFGASRIGEYYPCAKVGEVAFAEASFESLNRAFALEGEAAVA